MIINKSVFRNIRSKKVQYIGISILMFLAIVLYISLNGSVNAIQQSNKDFKEQNQQEDLHFILQKPLSNQEINEISKDHNAVIEKRYSLDLSVGDDQTIRLFSITSEVNIPYIKKGKIPNDENEIALNKSYLAKNDLKIGDKIEYQGEKLKVTGTVILPDYIYPIKNETDLVYEPSTFGIGVTKKDTLKNFANHLAPTYIGKLKGENSVDKLSSLREDIVNNNVILSWVPVENNPRIQFIDAEISGIESMSSSIPIFVLILAVIMVAIIMRRMIQMERKQIGVLLALGLRKKEVFLHYLRYPTYIWVISVVLGIIIGILSVGPILNYFEQYYNLPIEENINLSINNLLVAILLPGVFIFLPVILILRKSLRISPLDLLQQGGVSKGKKSVLEKTTLVKKASFEQKYKLRNLLGNKMRVFFLSIGVLFSTVLLMYGLISYNAFGTLIDSTYKETYQYNYSVVYNTPKKVSDDFSKDNVFTLAQVKTVNDKDVTFQIYGISPETQMVKLRDENGNLLNEQVKEGLILSKSLAEKMGVEVGDQLKLDSYSANNNKKLTVSGIAELYVGQKAFYSRSSLNQWIGLDQNTYSGKWTEDKPSVKKSNVLLFQNKEDLIESFESSIGPMRNVVLGISILSFVIGLIILGLITNLIVHENSGTISLMKIMGYRKNEISRLLLNIYTPVVLISYLIGIPVSVYALKNMMSRIAETVNFSYPINMNLTIAVIGFVVIGLTYYGALYFSRRSINKIALIEALKKQAE